MFDPNKIILCSLRCRYVFLRLRHNSYAIRIKNLIVSLRDGFESQTKLTVVIVVKASCIEAWISPLEA